MSLWDDARFAVRALLRDRSFTVTAASVLALGIAANAMALILINGLLWDELPFHEPDRLVTIESREARTNRTWNMSYLDLGDVQGAIGAFAGVEGANQTSMHVADDRGRAERLTGAYVSGGMFRLLGWQPAIGRDFTPEDDLLGAEPVILLGHRFWQQRYGGETGVLGRSIRVNGVPSTVIGVMPEHFAFPETSELWQPLAMLPPSLRERRDGRTLDVIARLAPRATLQQAAAELEVLMAGLAHQYPETNAGIAATVLPYRESVVGGRAFETFAAVSGAVTFLLLLACANVANLFTARVNERTREMSIRASLGAVPWRLARQLFVESLLLSAVAGVAGLAIGAAGARLVAAALAAADAPYWLTFPMDVRVGAGLVAVCIATAIIVSLLPSVHTLRTNLASSVNDAGRVATASRGAQASAGALVAVQVTLAVVLLTGGGLMLRSAIAQVWQDAGVITDGLVTMRLELPAPRYQTSDARDTFYRRLDDLLAESPDMLAAIGTPAPRMGGPQRTVVTDRRLTLPGERPPRVTTVAVGQRYFDAVGIAPLVGRTFDPLDDGRAVVVVNERLAAEHFPDGAALGERIELGPDYDPQPSGWLTIVGVVPNVRQGGRPDTWFDPVAYLPHTASPLPNAMIVARSAAGVEGVAERVWQAVRSLDADLPIFAVASLDDALARERWPLRVFGTLYGVFAIAGLTLAAAGLYAVVAAGVVRRTREIGIRVALGATRRHVWWTVNERVARPLAIGIAIGVAGAFALGQVLQGILAGVSGRDPVTLAVVPALLILVAFFACLLPARKAMRVNPVDTLRAG